MNEVIWAILSEWDGINTKVKVLVSSGLRGIGCKLEESWIASKMTNQSESFRGSSLRGISGEFKES